MLRSHLRINFVERLIHCSRSSSESCPSCSNCDLGCRSDKIKYGYRDNSALHRCKYFSFQRAGGDGKNSTIQCSGGRIIEYECDLESERERLFRSQLRDSLVEGPIYWAGSGLEPRAGNCPAG